MRSTHEEMEQRLPHMQLLRLHARPHAASPARRARRHATAHHMPIDGHAGGDQPRATSLVTHVGTATPVGTASTCVRFIHMLMLQHEALCNIRLKQVKHL
jgi:hypothetical protein